jgi:hypothetical protein
VTALTLWLRNFLERLAATSGYRFAICANINCPTTGVDDNDAIAELGTVEGQL